ncbi:MAG TPA: hypothetical protein VKP61_00770 [Candidatus Acidoferrum sp.]|nr:hypothetical protein [Candidatus Acidoferrum sp.]
MATTAASYRSTQASHQVTNQQPVLSQARTLHQVCRDLEALIAAGFVEAYRDEHNIVRYRPTNGRVA